MNIRMCKITNPNDVAGIIKENNGLKPLYATNLFGNWKVILDNGNVNLELLRIVSIFINKNKIVYEDYDTYSKEMFELTIKQLKGELALCNFEKRDLVRWQQRSLEKSMKRVPFDAEMADFFHNFANEEQLNLKVAVEVTDVNDSYVGSVTWSKEGNKFFVSIQKPVEEQIYCSKILMSMDMFIDFIKRVVRYDEYKEEENRKEFLNSLGGDK